MYERCSHLARAHTGVCFAPGITPGEMANADRPAPWNNTLSAQATGMRSRNVSPSYPSSRMQIHLREVPLAQVLVSVRILYRHMPGTALQSGPNCSVLLCGQGALVAVAHRGSRDGAVSARQQKRRTSWRERFASLMVWRP